jgi:hypothetical protein
MGRAVFTTSDTKIQQSVTQTKWYKAKAQIAELATMISESADGLLNYKRLEQIRGFLCHLAMTYLIVSPYLKGLHLTLASHHPGRDKFGLKMGSKEWAAYLYESVERGKLTEEEAETMSRASVEPVSAESKDGEKAPHPERQTRNPSWILPRGLKQLRG